jgi:uncharacterized membrane protein YeaQ/YmgE (transglycosylase-associated protein family)
MPLWLYWIIFGLLAGGLAKFVVPGRDPPGCILTVILGLSGALVGGWLGTRFGWGAVRAGAFDLHSIAIATSGAIALLLLGRILFRRRRQP